MYISVWQLPFLRATLFKFTQRHIYRELGQLQARQPVQICMYMCPRLAVCYTQITLHTLA